jgi:hypothetical protein
MRPSDPYEALYEALAPVKEKAVLDRIADNRLAVPLIGDEERELHVPIDQLPADASPGCWMQVTIFNKKLITATIDTEQTERVAAHISKQLDTLRKRGSSLKPEWPPRKQQQFLSRLRSSNASGWPHDVHANAPSVQPITRKP